jgi:uncharacterized repeat protein (TIGR04052 family)
METKMKNTLPYLALLSLGAVACTSDKDPEPPPPVVDTAPDIVEVTINFRAKVDGLPFDCASGYNYLGATGGASVQIQDFRLFVSNVSLLNAAEEATVITLDQTSPFQHEQIALLDFESGEFNCDGGTPELNTTVTGTMPSGDYTGLAFTIGVPFERNHANIDDTTPELLANPDLFRSLLQGYYFFKVDLVASGGDPDGYPLHVTSSGCQANELGSVNTCLSPNRVTFTFDDFDNDNQEVVLDIGTLMARNDLERNGTSPAPANVPTPIGCQSDTTDPDCQDFFISYGLSALPQEWITVE